MSKFFRGVRDVFLHSLFACLPLLHRRLYFEKNSLPNWHWAEVEPHFHKIIFCLLYLHLTKVETLKNCINIISPWLFALTSLICLCFFFHSHFLPNPQSYLRPLHLHQTFLPQPQAVWWIYYSFFATFVDCCSRFGGQFHLCKTHRLKHRLLLIISHKAITDLQYDEVNYA